MLRLIYGCPGSQKSDRMRQLIADSLKAEKQVILIVPERFSLTAEIEIMGLFGDKDRVNLMNLEILSFRRLCNRVFREYGGICYNYAGVGGQMLMMWRALASVKSKLTAYKKLRLRDAGTIETMLQSIVSFRRSAIPAKAFRDAAKDTSLDPSLQNKLNDLASIYEAYDDLLKKKYDDPEKDLTRLNNLLLKKSFFKDKEVYVDSTAAFTEQELNILCRALEQADSVTVALEALPLNDAHGNIDTRPMLEKMHWCEERLRKAAKEANCGETEVLGIYGKPVGKSEDLVALEKWLYAEGAPQYKGAERSMVLRSCTDIYEECKTVAARILRDVKENNRRYRDHCVVVRDLSVYAGILDRVFESNGIPYTTTEKAPLASRAAVRAVRSALRLTTGGFRIDDILSYIKTGYTGLTDEQAFELEEYINIWQIEGDDRWTKGGEFTMNPAGHTGEWRDKDREKLARINEARKTLAEPLKELSAAFGKCENVEDCAYALYRYILKMHLYEKLEEARKACAKSGDGLQEAMWHEQTYGALCDVLEELAYSAGSERCDKAKKADFALMFEMVLDKKKLGSIPPGRDRVLICDAFNLKPGKILVLHALGLNDGIFPAPVKSTGLFSRKEKETLQKLNLDLPGNDERAALDEEYLAYTVLTLPREKLYVTNHKKNLQGVAREPSDLFDDLTRFYEDQKEENEDFLYGKANIYDAAFAGDAKDAETDAALKKLVADKSAEYEERRKNAPLIAINDNIGAAMVGQVYPGEAPPMSLSKIETFRKCPFSYTCKYLLRLNEPASEKISQNEIGTLVHAVLQHLIENSLQSGRRFRDYTENEVVSQTEEVLAATKDQMTGGESDAQIDSFFKRITDVVKFFALNLRDEFGHSSFEPAFCEVQFEGSGSPDGSTLPGIKVGNNYKFTITGKVDRVDVCRTKDSVYLRIVDYKTGSSGHDSLTQKALENGEKMQMPLYMRALLDNKDGAFLQKIGADDGREVLPAAVLYHITAFPKSELPVNASADELESAIRKTVTRAGMLLDDAEVLQAIDETPDGQYVAGVVPTKKGGKVSLDAFRSALDGLDDTVSQIAEQMHTGDAHTDKSDCTYCAMAPICRRESKEDKDDADN